MTTYFTSDQHFFHRNVIDFCNRPFKDVEEMNESLINAWNKVVTKKDTVIQLGDFVFGNYDKWTSILDRLHGDIVFIKGNHDDSKPLKRLAADGYFKEFHEVGKYMKVEGYQLWLSHYPMDIGERPKKYSISGHIHDTPSRLLNQVNVGIDSPLNFNRPFGQPIHIDELINYLNHIDPQVEETFMRQKGLIV